ncbi:MAG TPA: DUF4245 domain-containing protein [Candidatus Stackebrandtia excrementipullorum]|nr:DUF4245 domain-containing protein [Candidatus Stackebrandtia excrementipullorum]
MSTSEEAARPVASGRQDRRPRDMVLSLAVLLLPIGAFFLFWNFLTSDQPVSEIDPSSAYMQAEGMGMTVSPPSGLSEEWRPLSSAVNEEEGAVTLRVGYYTPSAGGMQFIASQSDPVDLLENELGTAPRPEGELTVGSLSWQTYVTVGGNSALVYSTESVTLIVHGDGPPDELVEFAEALTP